MLEKSLRSALSAIVILERELSDTLRGTAESIRFPDAVSTTSARATALFERIAFQYSDSSNRADGASHFKVEELNRNYTMAHEREVHEAVIGASTALEINTAVEPNAPLERNDDMLVTGFEEGDPTPNGVADDEELADNVELF
jgi:hypothetical protein